MLNAHGREDGPEMETTAGAVDEINAGAVLRAALTVTAFGPGGGAPGDLDDDATLTLLSQRPMTFQDSEVEMQDRVGALGTAVDDAVDHGLPPKCAKMLRDIVFRMHLDAFRRALLADPPARVERMTVPLQPGTRAVRATRRASPIVYITGDENYWADLAVTLGDAAGGSGQRARGRQVHGGDLRWERQVSDEGGCARRAGDRRGGRTHP